MNVVSAIQTAYPNMTKVEKKVADFFFTETDGHYILHITLSELSREIGVGQASIMRMINSCGYSSYRTFMAELSQEKYQVAADAISARTTSSLADDWSQMIRLCQENLNRDELVLAAQTICKADFVICLGYGNSAHVAALAASHFRRAGRFANLNVPGEISYAPEGFGPNMRAVVISFSISGETPDIIRMSKEYAESGVCLIALTGRTESSLSKLANFTFFTPSQTANLRRDRQMDGMATQLFVVESLVEEIRKIMYGKETED